MPQKTGVKIFDAELSSGDNTSATFAALDIFLYVVFQYRNLLLFLTSACFYFCSK